MKTNLQNRGSCIVALGLVLTSLGCGGGSPPSAAPKSAAAETNSAPPESGQVRLPAVAGLFYPKSAEQLSAMVDRLLASTPTPAVTNVKALICPHAGYPYSGPVAAHAYKAIAGREFDTVIILAPSHYADFRGVSVPAASAYQTPLGRVPVSAKARALARQAPFVLEPRCFVQRPPWWSEASKPAPAVGDDTPETWEHAVEVQLPFLQRTLKTFKILPVVFGNADPGEVARRLAPLVDDHTLVIASTDLSHYHPYAEAKELDRRTLKWICDLNLEALQSPRSADSACGRMGVLTLMQLARLKGWTPHLLDARNSGDTSGDKSRVVGYAAIAFTGSGASSAQAAGNKAAPARFSETERKFLLGLARQSLERATSNRALPEVDAGGVPDQCKENKGCFVTLTKAGELRGCIGNILPAGPLYRAVMENARSAALRDPRFPPVISSEAESLHIEISVLSDPEPLPFISPEDLLAKLRPKRDGVLLRVNGHAATFLPQVWDQLPDKVEFLDHLAQKAGCPPSAWRGSDVTVSVYHAEAFEEPK